CRTVGARTSEHDTGETFRNKLGSRVASLERWGSGERLGKIVVFLNLTLHQPRNLQRVLSVQSTVSTLPDLVSTLLDHFALYLKHCVDTT
ncbi:hypothetical protein Taro_018803, partial [Colocasia esculenta]|nr:hypothetical protein [Colocasia esculenta]